MVKTIDEVIRFLERVNGKLEFDNRPVPGSTCFKMTARDKTIKRYYAHKVQEQSLIDVLEYELCVAAKLLDREIGG